MGYFITFGVRVLCLFALSYVALPFDSWCPFDGTFPWYIYWLLRFDVASNVISFVLLLPCQMLTLGPEDSLDFLRTMRMASYGLLISGPTLHLWFNFLSKVFPKKDVVNTLKKMFLGQAVYGPIINSVFFSYNAGLQGIIAYVPP